MIRTTALVIAGLALSAGIASACPYSMKTVDISTPTAPITTAQAPTTAPSTVQQ